MSFPNDLSARAKSQHSTILVTVSSSLPIPLTLTRQIPRWLRSRERRASRNLSRRLRPGSPSSVQRRPPMSSIVIRRRFFSLAY